MLSERLFDAESLDLAAKELGDLHDDLADLIDPR
jgi:hypothetical protein